MYEINTRVWLEELSLAAGYSLTLASVSDYEWDRIASLGFKAVWLMGVWERSPEGIRISMNNESLLTEFHRALPDFEVRDNVGSPYCIRRYVVDPHFGGPDALVEARTRLSGHGLHLILDFVPNHVAPDHPWVTEHPEYFILGSEKDLADDPLTFVVLANNIYACGRDPYFPAWTDVLQLNAFDPGLRFEVIKTLAGIASQCDGVRCDMAMLVMNNVFENTWGIRAGKRPDTDYWSQIISDVKNRHPEFKFIAEAYWDLEWELQQQGFDFCYDKRLYDRLLHGPAEQVRLHLCANKEYQENLVRFIENHDEPRAATAFPADKHKAVAITALTLPGMRLIHEGQMEGRKIRIPVFLARRPGETPIEDLSSFYHRLLETLNRKEYLKGKWCLCECSGWPDNYRYLNLVSWCWQNDESFCIIVVNLSDTTSQGRVHIPLHILQGKLWLFQDLFTYVRYEKYGDNLLEEGLYVELPPWGFHFLENISGL